MALTLGLTVFVDLVTAVAIGLIAAGMVHASQLEGLELDSVFSVPLLDHHFFAGADNALTVDRYAARTGLVRLNGSFTVASSQKLHGVIGGDIVDHEVVIFDFSGATYIDDSAAMTISRLFTTAAREDTECIVMGLSGKVALTVCTRWTFCGICRMAIWWRRWTRRAWWRSGCWRTDDQTRSPRRPCRARAAPHACADIGFHPSPPGHRLRGPHASRHDRQP